MTRVWPVSPLMKTLPRVLLLLGLATLISNSSATAADDPLPSLDELLKEYQSLGFPLPPSTANLVRYEGRRHWDENGILHSSTYGLAFQLKPGTSTERPVVLRAIHEWGPKDSDGDPRTRQVKPDATAARDIDLYPETALALAIQCHARGWDELAKELLTSSKLKETEVTTRERLLDMAWSYWTSQLTHPTADRSLAAKRLNELILRGADFDTESNRALLKSGSGTRSWQGEAG